MRFFGGNSGAPMFALHADRSESTFLLIIQ